MHSVGLDSDFRVYRVSAFRRDGTEKRRPDGTIERTFTNFQPRNETGVRRTSHSLESIASKKQGKRTYSSNDQPKEKTMLSGKIAFWNELGQRK